MPPKSKGTGARPRRGASQKDADAVATPKTPRDTSPHSPGGGIETLPDGGGYRATVDGRVLGTFATLQEAASEMTHAAMTPPASRTTPRSRAKRSEPSHGVTTPEHAARTPLPGNPARSGDAKPDPEKTLYARRRDRNVFTRAFVMCAVLAVLVALLDPNIASTASTRLGALVSEWRGVTADGAAVAAKPESCASEVARFDAVAALAAEGWRETAWLFLEAAREANARHREETDSIASRGFGGLLFSNPPTRRPRASAASRLGAKKGVALALVAQTRFDSGPDDRVAFAARAAFACDCVETFDVEKYVALALSDVVNARGALQRAMSAFLEKCPRGVAVIAHAHRLTPPLLAALAPAVSEGGASCATAGRARGRRDVRAHRRAGRGRGRGGGVARARRGGVRARRQGGDGASLARSRRGRTNAREPSRRRRRSRDRLGGDGSVPKTRGLRGTVSRREGGLEARRR